MLKPAPVARTAAIRKSHRRNLSSGGRGSSSSETDKRYVICFGITGENTIKTTATKILVFCREAHFIGIESSTTMYRGGTLLEKAPGPCCRRPEGPIFAANPSRRSTLSPPVFTRPFLSRFFAFFVLFRRDTSTYASAKESNKTKQGDTVGDLRRAVQELMNKSWAPMWMTCNL